MGWKVATKKFGKETKYKLWSTITDRYITKSWMTRKEITCFFFWHRFEQFANTFIEDAMTFPDGYTSKNNDKIITTGLMDEFFKFKSKSIRDNKIMWNKFLDELNNQDIKISIKDNKYQIEN